MRRFLTLAAGAAAMGLSTGAFAQFGGTHTLDATPNSFSFRGGFILPLDNSLRDLNNTWLGLGLDYRFDRSLIQGGETYLSMDWMSRNLSGNTYNIFPVMVNQRFKSQGDPSMYYFLGAGIVFYDNGPADNVFGARGGIGKMLNESVFVEAVLSLAEEDKNGRQSSNVAVFLGYRF